RIEIGEVKRFHLRRVVEMTAITTSVVSPLNFDAATVVRNHITQLTPALIPKVLYFRVVHPLNGLSQTLSHCRGPEGEYQGTEHDNHFCCFHCCSPLSCCAHAPAA